MNEDSSPNRDQRAPANPPAGRPGTEAPSRNLFVKKVLRGGESAEGIHRPSISYWQDAWMRIKKNKVAISAGFYIIFISLAAAIIPEFLPYKYDEQEIWNKHMMPTFKGAPAIVVTEESLRHTPVRIALPADTSPHDGADTVVTDPPAPPANLQLIGAPLTTAVALRWDQVPGVDGYRVYRSISDDTLGIPLEDIPAHTLSFQDTSSLQGGDTYYYAVTSYNSFGDSAPSQLLKISPKLSLPLAEAIKLDPNVKVGVEVMTHPHYLGTDYLGRDMLARVLAGARVSLGIGILAPLLYMLIGVVYGCISGYIGGMTDNIMMRVAEIISTIPYLLIVIMVQVFLGAGPTTLIIALVVASWAVSAQQVRGEVLRLRESEFVHAALVLGTPFHKIIFRHLLPNVMGTVLVLLTLAIPQAMFAEAFLSFIGLGIAPPMPSWGSVTREGAKVFLTYPHELIIPAVVMSVTMLTFNLFGDGLRDALDPKMRGAR